MPDCLVKSFPSSTSALAGSQAAQHKVSCLAAAGLIATADNATPANSASAPPAHFDLIPVADFRMCFPLVTHSLAASGAPMSESDLMHRSPSGLEACRSVQESNRSAHRRPPISLGVASRRDVQFSLLLNIRYLFHRTVKRNVQELRAM